MRFIIPSLVAAASLMIASSAFPADMAELEKKLQCNVCHAIDKKIVGPSWLEISKAYNSNGTTVTGRKVSDILAGKTAEDWLVITISQGGVGNWGTMPMPALDPNGVNQADARELVAFILELAKGDAAKPETPVAEKIHVPAINIKGDLLALSKKYKCTACHAMDKKVIGPTWMEISEAYNSNGTTRTGKKISDILRFHTAEKWLLFSISQGGAGNWGSNTMPANDPNYNNEIGITEMVRLILELAR